MSLYNWAIRNLVAGPLMALSGRDVFGELSRLERSQWLGRDELLELQRGRLESMLCYAWDHSPY